MHETDVEGELRGAGTAGAIAVVVQRLELAWSLIAAVFLFAIMLIIVVDVASRYLLNSPLPWSFDVVSMYLMIGLFFLMLSDTQRVNGHVQVDILYAKAPPRLRHLMDLVSSALALVVFVGILYTSTSTTWNSWSAGEVLSGSFMWPVWLSHIFIPFGVALLVARLFVEVLRHAAALAGRRRDDS